MSIANSDNNAYNAIFLDETNVYYSGTQKEIFDTVNILFQVRQGYLMKYDKAGVCTNMESDILQYN